MLADNDAVRIPDQAPAVVGKGSGEGGPTLLCAARVVARRPRACRIRQRKIMYSRLDEE